MCLQPMSKDGEAGQCGDRVWQVVPNAGCGSTEHPVADRQVTCPWNDEGHGQRRLQPSSGCVPCDNDDVLMAVLDLN